MKAAIFSIVVALGSCGSATAQTVKPKAPDYYVDMAIAMSLAEQYAGNCPVVGVNEQAYATLYQSVLDRLVSDGFPSENPHQHMQFPPASKTDAIIVEMLEKHTSASDAEASFCAQALAEIDAQSLVGSLMEKSE